jgi:hypothetical protein
MPLHAKSRDAIFSTADYLFGSSVGIPSLWSVGNVLEREYSLFAVAAGVPRRWFLHSTARNCVNLRLKRHQSLALQTVPVGKTEPSWAQVVLFDLSFFGR